MEKAENTFSEFAYVLPPVFLLSIHSWPWDSIKLNTTWYGSIFAGSSVVCAQQFLVVVVARFTSVVVSDEEEREIIKIV